MFRSETLHLVSKLQHYKILKILEEKFTRPSLTSSLGRPVRLRILPFDQCELIFHFRQFWKVVDLIVERPEYLQELKNQSQLILICSVSFLFVVCQLHGRHSITANSQIHTIVLYATSRVVKILYSYLSKLKIILMCILQGLRYLYCFYSFLFNLR